LKIEWEKRVLFSSDDPQEAFDDFRKRQENGEKGIAFADVRNMIDPPKVSNRYVVLGLVEIRH